MAVERQPQFVIDLGREVQARLNAFIQQRNIIRAQREAELQRRFINGEISLEGLLAYRQQQLENERNKEFPDQEFISNLEVEIANLKKQIRYKRFRDKQFQLLRDMAEGRKSIADQIEFLNEQLQDAIDDDLRNEIRNSLLDAINAKEEMDRRIEQAKINFYQKDRTLDSLNKAEDLIKKALSRPETINNPEIANAYHLKLQAIQKEKNQVAFENKLHEFTIEMSRLSDYAYPSVAKLNLLQNQLRTASETTPIEVNGVRYNSEKEYWQSVLSDYINNDLIADFNNEIKKNIVLIKRQKGELPDNVIKSIKNQIDNLKSNPALAGHKNLLAELEQTAGATVLNEKVNEIKDKYNLGTSLASRFDVWRAKNEVAKYQNYFPTISLEPVLKQFETTAAERQVQIAQNIASAAVQYMSDHPEVSFKEAIKKVAPLVSAPVSQEEFMKPQTGEELAQRLAKMVERPEEIAKQERRAIQEITQPKETTAVPETKQEYETYKLKKGETLWQVAKNFLGSGVRWKELLKPDNTPFTEREAATLQPGQIIKIPKVK